MFIKTFKQLTKKDVNIAGGKGASLGEMLNNKMPVPPGFVVLAGAFDRFLQETDLAQEIDAQLEKVNYDDVNSVDRASNVIRDLIHDAKTPEDLEKYIVGGFKKMKCKLVAVRSSATAEDSSVASWAGELESYLNTTEKTLLANVKKMLVVFIHSAGYFLPRGKGFARDACKRSGSGSGNGGIGNFRHHFYGSSGNAG